MEYLIYLLLPFIWFFMLLEWVYKKTRNLFYWAFYEPEPGKQKRQRGGERKAKAASKPKSQGGKIPEPEEKPSGDDGMAAQEKTIPQIIPEPKKPEPEKKKPPVFVFEPPKRETLKRDTKKKERRGIER